MILLLWAALKSQNIIKAKQLAQKLIANIQLNKDKFIYLSVQLKGASKFGQKDNFRDFGH
jgi:hypothetical protein